MKRTIAEIAQMITIKNDLSPFSDVQIEGVCFDTRQIKPGDLFVPFVGAERDGHIFVEQARKSGARASLWQQNIPDSPTDFPVLIVDDTLVALQDLAKAYKAQVNPKVIAITGSNGKTTTKDITKAIIQAKYRVHATAGNFNNHIGLPFTLLTMPEDTEVAVLEMGMNHRHEIECLSAIAEPDIALITNIGEAHIENLGSRAEIARAKLEITVGMRASGLLIYPADEPLITENFNKELRTATFGSDAHANIYPLQIQTEAEGTTFTTNLAKDVTIYVPIIGEHNVANTMAALLAAKELGTSIVAASSALANIERSKNRLEWLETKQGTRILNDAYNSSPTALQAVLKTFMNMKASHKRKLIVVADMLELGTESAAFHKSSADVLEPGKIDIVYTYGEQMAYFASEAANRIGSEHVFHFDSKDSLIASLLKEVTGNEWILIKGSNGMGLKQVVEALMKND